MHTNIETLRIYWRHIKKYKTGFFVTLFCVPTAALLLDTALPYFLSQAIGTLGQNNESLTQYLLFAAIAGVVGVAFNLTGFQTVIGHEVKVRTDLVDSTLGALLAKDADFFANQKIGALTSKFIDFINGHVALQDLFILRTLSFGLTMIAGITIIFFHSMVLGFLVIALMLWLFLQIKIMLKIRKPYREARKKQVAEINGAAADAIGNYLTVKTFAREDAEMDYVHKASEVYATTYKNDFRRLSVEGSLRLLIMAVTQVTAIIVIASLLKAGSIELGIAIFLLAYLQRLAGQLFTLGELINGYDKVFLASAPMTEILLEPDAVTDVEHARELVIKRGHIAFKDVTYAYRDAKERVVLNHLNLTIPAGQKVGIVGHSGAGKTTITKLLLRFADVDSGTLEIDGQNIREATQASLRRSLSFVPQEPLLFHRSLRENIAYGRPEATQEQLHEAARRAHALEFIEELPQGFETVVGERGVKLSGGQRQRIALARAILKDAPILVLDEATSALDSESEKLIQASLDELMKDRTAIVIAHRLSTIAKLDRIVVLDKGSIVEDGTHEQLINNKGIYAKLWSHQSGGFITE